MNTTNTELKQGRTAMPWLIVCAVFCALAAAQGLAATPLTLEYTVTGTAAPYSYSFRLVNDNNDGTFQPGDGFGWIIFGDSSTGASPLTGFVLTSITDGPPAWSSVELATQFGHTGWRIWSVFMPWFPDSVGDSVSWTGTATSYVGIGQMLFSSMIPQGGAQTFEYEQAVSPASQNFAISTTTDPPFQVYPDDTTTYSAGTLTLTNQSTTATYTTSTLDLGAVGNGNDTVAYTMVSFIEDNPSAGTQGVLDAADTTIASFSDFPVDNGVVTVSYARTFAPQQVRVCFVAAKFGGTPLALPTELFRTRVSNLVFSGTSPGFVAPRTLPGFAIKAPVASVANVSPSQAIASPGSSGKVLGSFSVTLDEGPAIEIGTMALDPVASAGGALSHIARLDIHLDANSNNQLDAGESALAGSNSISFGMTINFSVPRPSFAAAPPAVTQRFFVVAQFSASAPNGAQFTVSLRNLFFNYGAGLWTPAGLPTSQSNGLLISTTGLSVVRNGPAAPQITQAGAQGANGNGLLLLDLTLTTSLSAWNVNALTFTSSGTADEQADMNFLGLYIDTNNSGLFDGPTTDLLATSVPGVSFSAPNGSYTASLLNTNFPASSSRRFFLMCKLSGSASAGETFHAELTSVSATPPAGGQVIGLPSGGGIALEIDTPRVVATLNGPASFSSVPRNSQGSSGDGEVLCDLTLAATGANFTITSLTFTASGTGNDATAFSQLALFEDGNGNGVFDGAGADSMATASPGVAFSADNGQFSANLGNTAFTQNVPRRFFLAARLNGSAMPGQTFNAALTGVNITAPAGGVTQGVPTSASSALVIEQTALTVTNSPSAPQVQYAQGGSAFSSVIACFRFAATGGTIDISSIDLTTGGSGSFGADLDPVNGVELFMDDGNGVFDGTPGDTLVFSGPGSGPVMSCALSPMVSVPAGQHRSIWVRINLLGTAGGALPETFSVRIAAPGDVSAAAQIFLGNPTPNGELLSVVIFLAITFSPPVDQQSGGAAITITGSGFIGPFALTINGVTCPGLGIVDATGTQITGFTVPPGNGQNRAIVLTSALGPIALPMTFDYAGGTNVSGGKGKSNDDGCNTGGGHAPWLMLLTLLTIAALGRRALKRN